jgi:RND family efflux transporter MFP subunit
LLVERGATVKFGDPLVRLDASSAALSAQSVRAQLGAAQAQERLAAEECKRAQALLDKGAITRSQYDREITSCTAAAQTVAATKAQLGLVSKSIADGVVRAPFAGRVDGRWVSPGEYVGPGMRLVTLVDDDPLKVELSVPEAYVPRIALDQAVEVGWPPRQAFPAKVAGWAEIVNPRSPSGGWRRARPDPRHVRQASITVGTNRAGAAAGGACGATAVRRVVARPRAARRQVAVLRGVAAGSPPRS